MRALVLSRTHLKMPNIVMSVPTLKPVRKRPIPSAKAMVPLVYAFAALASLL
jgi:hypothetical protein